MAPNMLPWSVSAMAGMPASAAALITSSRRLAPSSRLNWLWRWRWTKSDIAGVVVLNVWYQMPRSPAALHLLLLHPAVAVDVVEPGCDGEPAYEVEGRIRRQLDEPQ